MKDKFYITLLGVLLLIILAVIIGFLMVYRNKTISQELSHVNQTPKNSTPNNQIKEEKWKTYSSDIYKITFEYPSSWYRSINDLGVSGTKGEDIYIHMPFFEKKETIDRAAKILINWKQDPYGVDPEVEVLRIGDQEARLIIPMVISLPGEDLNLAGMTGLLVKYPKPIKIINKGNEAFQYLIINFSGMNIDYVREIVKTIDFITN